MEKKQTAIEWLVLQVNSDCLTTTFIRKELIDQAIEMEKQQVETAYERGLNFPWALGCEIDNYQEEAKQYYQANYGKQV